MTEENYELARRERLLRQLTAIKNRYFFKSIAHPEGSVTHLTACGIYHPKVIYGWVACTCGLLDDLRFMGHRIADKIFPKYQDHQYLQDAQGVPRDPKEKEELDKVSLIESILGKIEPISPEELAKMDAEEWSLVEEVFGGTVTDSMKRIFWA